MCARERPRETAGAVIGASVWGEADLSPRGLMSRDKPADASTGCWFLCVVVDLDEQTPSACEECREDKCNVEVTEGAGWWC